MGRWGASTPPPGGCVCWGEGLGLCPEAMCRITVLSFLSSFFNHIYIFFVMADVWGVLSCSVAHLPWKYPKAFGCLHAQSVIIVRDALFKEGRKMLWQWH